MPDRTAEFTVDGWEYSADLQGTEVTIYWQQSVIATPRIIGEAQFTPTMLVNRYPVAWFTRSIPWDAAHAALK